MRRHRLAALVAAVIAAGALIVAGAVLDARVIPWGAWTLIGAAFLLGLLIVDLSEVSAESVGFALVASALWQFGVGAAVFAAVAGEVGSALRSPRPQAHRSAFNAAAHAIATIPVGALMLAAESGGWSLKLAALVPGSLVYFAISSGLVAVAIGWSSESIPRAVWQSNFRWLAAHYPALAVVGAILARGQEAAGALGVLVFCVPVLMSHYSVNVFVRRTREQMTQLASANARLEAMNGELTATLASVVDARDLYLYRHSHQASDYTERIARRLALPEEEIQLAKKAALLHDIGKVGIPEAVLRKPGPLDEAERAIMNSHAEIGFEIVSRTRELAALAPIVRAHHERFDGKGYPDGLKGKKIPQAARIISVLEAFDAMISDRPYRKGRSIEEALEEVARHSGTQFDPEVVRAFLAMIEEQGTDWARNSAEGSPSGADLFLPKGVARARDHHHHDHEEAAHVPPRVGVAS